MLLVLLFSLLSIGSDSILTKVKEVKDFTNAVSLTYDGKENIYVLDANSNQIVKFDINLEYLKRNGKQGWGEGQFDSPTYIDGSSGLDIFISDGKNKRILRFDLELNQISALYTSLVDFPSDLQFNTPAATLILNSREIYAIDGDNNRIVVYKDGKNPVSVFGDYTSGKGQLARPVKLLKDGNNNIYVLDKEFNSIFRFDNLGNYVGSLDLKGIVSFSISGDILYILMEKEIVLYDLNRRNIIGRKGLPGKYTKQKYREILVLNNKKYLLLSKNALCLFQENK